MERPMFTAANIHYEIAGRTKEDKSSHGRTRAAMHFSGELWEIQWR
jgi:hypothetical protein